MKDIYKNPILYYIVAPVIVILWPLFVWAIYLPAAEKDVIDRQAQHREAEETMMEILTLDPDRRELVDSNNVGAEFTYAGAIDNVARSCGIVRVNISSVQEHSKPAAARKAKVPA